ncbi:kinesin light chain 4-like isoform X2 [Biomphalaria pfeifferi]|uniref:Kinesin light chain 4-like isoform X2 n=1 Tax=Biomphalaria pfeifferi TaxID=112525 RepID=A0AAD8F9F3_BIOPF|nr:kinesin light chain 4-like isoform X2 [Biomphalaria pfeifferi]
MILNAQFPYSSKNFLCHVTLKAEENQRIHGKGLLHGCHVRDWPLLRDLMQTAFQCRSYPHLLKAAVMGRNLIISCFPNDSKEFYEIMYNSTKIYGSPSQKAVMQICLAQAIASKKGADLPNALTYVESAIETLQCYGPNFFYKLALWKKAKLLEVLGDHCQALEYFLKAREESHLTALRVESDDILQVTQLQMEEESLLAEIQEARPLIFSGKNVQAKEKLMMLYETINDRYDNHPEFAEILNGIGLVIQRGTKDTNEAFEWYNRSFKERLHTQNICPQNMVASMNHMSMILCRQGNPDAGENYLRRSLAILEKSDRNQYLTAVTLTHLSEVKVKQGDYYEAYKATIEAELILREASKNHDFRLKIHLYLVHHILVLTHTNSSSCAVTSTVEDSMKCLIQLASSIKQYLSDHGHHYLMSAYEHALLMNWRDSEDTYQQYRRDLLEHIRKPKLLRDVLLKKDTSQFPTSFLKEHRHIVEYIRDTDYAQLDFLKLFSSLSEACPMCRNIETTPAEQLWRKEIEKLSYDRETIRNVLSPMPTSHESFERLSLSVSEVSEQNVQSGSQSCANQVEMLVMIPSAMQDSKVINPSDMPGHQVSFKVINPSEMQGHQVSFKVINPSEMKGHQVSFKVINPSEMQGHQVSFKVINPSEMKGHQVSFKVINSSEMQGHQDSFKVIHSPEMPSHIDNVTSANPSDVYEFGIAEITSSSFAYNSWEAILSFQSQKITESYRMDVLNTQVDKNAFPNANYPRTRPGSSFSSLDMNDLSFTVLDLSSSFVDITTAMPNAIECVDNPSGDSNSSSFDDVVNT